MITDSLNPEDPLGQPRESARLKLLAIVCAFGVSALLLTGYGYMRKRHAQQTLVSSAVVPTSDNGPKGPPQAHILVDDPLLNKGDTIIGGTVKNTSDHALTGVSIAMELRRRKDGSTEQTSVLVNPSQLEPQQEGTYALKLPVQTYASIRLVGLKADPQSTLLAYTSSPGKKRPPERLEPKVVVVKPSSSRKGGFLNTPDNPTRVP
jgi:hypothetical protein